MYPYVELLGRRIPSYGLCMTLGIIIASGISVIRARRRGLDVNSLIIVVACAVGLGFVGAKMLYLFVTYDAKEILGNMRLVVEGGQVYYGGLIGGILGTLLGARLAGERMGIEGYCYAIVPAIPIGHALGRIGCFMGGCCYGAPYTGVCAVSFPRVGVNEMVFPVQLLEAGLNVVIFGVLLLQRRNRKGTYLLGLYLLMYSAVRFVLEYFRGDEIRGLMQGLSTSQWISMGLCVCAIVLLVRNGRLGKRTAGV